MKKYLFVLLLVLCMGVAGGIPTLSNPVPSSNPQTNVGDSITFQIDLNVGANESANATWYVDGTSVSTSSNLTNTTLSYSPSSTYTSNPGTYNVTVLVTNNGTDSYTWTWSVVPAPPTLTYDPISTSITLQLSQSEDFKIKADQDVNVSWVLRVNGSIIDSLNRSVSADVWDTYTFSASSIGDYTLTATVSNANGSDSVSWDITVITQPVLSNPKPSSPVITVEDESVVFSVDVDQLSDVSWFINGTLVQTTTTNGTVQFSPSSSYTGDVGTYNVTVEAKVDSLSSNYTWMWEVKPKTYYTGNTVWVEGQSSTTYTWTPLSFGWFYYDIDGGVGSESITFRNIDAADRVVNEGDVIYTTSRDLVNYEYSPWGKYYVIGFLAKKYFAGYNDQPAGTGNVNVLSKGQLHQVLIDSDEKRTLYAGASIQLEEGYELFAREIDLEGNRVWLELKKDGEVVDSDFVSGGDTYIYKKDVGDVEDLPLILARVGAVFRGTETNVVFLQGLFQISEDYDEVKSGDRYGMMKISSVSSRTITMKSDDD
ncbi:hypothetical protein DRN72_03660, partial [Methanosarcinales archaeon]